MSSCQFCDVTTAKGVIRGNERGKLARKIPIEVDIGHHLCFSCHVIVVDVVFFVNHRNRVSRISCAIMENASRSSGLPRDVTVANENNDDAFLGDTLSLSQFNVGREIGKGQFSQVHEIFHGSLSLIHVRHLVCC